MNADAIVSLLLETTGMFVSIVLTPASRAELLRRVPPVHPDVKADHVTLAFDPDPGTLKYYQGMVGKRVRVPVTAVAADAKGQAVLVGADSQNEYPHITISVADGVDAVYSNELLATGGWDHLHVFTLEGDVVIAPLT